MKITKNAHIMRVVLEFIYTRNLDQDALANNHLALLDAAHEYLLPQLQRICCQGCIRSLSGEYLAHILGAVQLYEDKALKNACFDVSCAGTQPRCWCYPRCSSCQRNCPRFGGRWFPLSMSPQQSG